MFLNFKLLFLWAYLWEQQKKTDFKFKAHFHESLFSGLSIGWICSSKVTFACNFNMSLFEHFLVSSNMPFLMCGTTPSDLSSEVQWNLDLGESVAWIKSHSRLMLARWQADESSLNQGSSQSQSSTVSVVLRSPLSAGSSVLPGAHSDSGIFCWGKKKSGPCFFWLRVGNTGWDHCGGGTSFVQSTSDLDSFTYLGNFFGGEGSCKFLG